MGERFSMAWLLGLLCACQGPTQVQLVVDGDPEVRAALRSLEVVVWSREPTDIDGETESMVLEHTANIDGLSDPFLVPLAPRARDAARRYRVQVVANLREGGQITARAISGYAPSRTVRLIVYLARACVDAPECEPNQTCRSGACVDAEVPVETLCELGDDEGCDADAGTDGGDADVDDAAGDTGTVDTGMDAAVDTSAVDTGVDTNIEDSGPDAPDTGPLVLGGRCVEDWVDESGQVCSVLNNTGCIAGLSCGVADTLEGTPECGLRGDRGVGALCTSNAQCIAGTGCTGNGIASTCRPYCATWSRTPASERDCTCDEGHECQVILGTLGTYGGCIEACTDPIGGSGCASPDEHCGFSGIRALRCGAFSREPKPDGAACGVTAECRVGSFCGGETVPTRTCHPIVALVDGCSEELTYVPIGETDFGYCL